MRCRAATVLGLARAKFLLLLWRQWLADVAAAGLLSAPHVATMWAIDVLVILHGIAITSGDSKGLFALLHSSIRSILKFYGEKTARVPGAGIEPGRRFRLTGF